MKWLKALAGMVKKAVTSRIAPPSTVPPGLEFAQVFLDELPRISTPELRRQYREGVLGMSDGFDWFFYPRHITRLDRYAAMADIAGNIAKAIPPNLLHGMAQGCCEVTGTPRYFNQHCKCHTYHWNLGPCGFFVEGGNGRCVYCDHEKACDDVIKPWAQGELGYCKTVEIDEQEDENILTHIIPSETSL